jgi:hypothetical protein
VLAGPLAGRTAEVLPGVLRIDYDFSREGCGRDWRMREEKKNGHLTWLPVLGGEFQVRFDLSGEIGDVSLQALPVVGPGVDKAPAGLELTPEEVRREGKGLPAAAGGEKTARSVARIELGITGRDVFWGTPRFWGRCRLPDELLEATSAEDLQGWRPRLVLPAGAKAERARIECGFGAKVVKGMRKLRAQAGGVKLDQAQDVADPLLRAADLARVASSFRDVPAVAAQAELARVAALLKAGKLSDAQTAVRRFMEMYHDRTALTPRARELLEAIGKTESTRR